MNTLLIIAIVVLLSPMLVSILVVGCAITLGKRATKVMHQTILNQRGVRQ